MPASTQWEIVDDLYVKIDPVFHYLVWHAGQGELLHNDDTTVRILELMSKRANQTILAGMSEDRAIASKPSFKQQFFQEIGVPCGFFSLLLQMIPTLMPDS